MDASEVRAQLERILQSPHLAQSGRLSRFLRFVVEASLSANGSSVKEYAIGVEVFERGKDFDPRIDPIVRVQAAKLRSKLVEYYASAGAADQILISIPKGSYAPEIREQTAAAAAPRALKPALQRSHIAVLPFVNMSSDPENEYFSDGLTEELINRLACVPSLQVVARTSVFRFKGRHEDIREVGVKLNAGTVLEGSVRKVGDQLRITAQLIDVESGFHLFSRTYKREYKSVFELQDELAETVTREIAPPETEPAGHIKSQTENLDAYHVYLRAMFALANRFTEMDECVKLFHEALRIDPTYAPAHAGLAQAYFLRAWFYQLPSDQVLPLSKAAALRTLELDPDSAQGHSSMALIECGFEWRWAEAQERFRRAVELQPGLAMIYPFYTFCCLLPQRRTAEACEMIDRALSLDPFNPLIHACATFIYGRAARHEEALRHHTLAMEVNPGFPPIIGSAGGVYQLTGQLDKAIEAFRKACDLSQNAPYALSCLGHALAAAGELTEARRVLEQLLQHPWKPPADIATVYVALGEHGDALDYLETAVEKRNLHLLTIPGDPRFDPLRSDPRFQSILHRMGLSA